MAIDRGAGDDVIRLGSLCTGYGGFDMAVSAVLDAPLVWVSDVDPGACAVIDQRHQALNIGDIRRVDWSAVERPDVLTAGYPCQPFSEAGKGKGADDPRHLWPHVCDAVRHLRPDLVLLENVRGHLRNGFPEVLADLAALGFDAEWTLLRASDVGACHRRARLFVAAYPAGDRRQPWAGLRRRDATSDGWRLTGHDDREAAADTESEQREDEPARGDCPTLPFSTIVGAGDRADPWHPPEGVVIDRRGARVVAWGVYEPAIRRHEQLNGRPHPFPQNDRGLLDERFVEWMQALPAGWVTDVVGRSSAMKLLGNGVVPPAAVAAVDHLLSIIEEDEADAA